MFKYILYLIFLLFITNFVCAKETPLIKHWQTNNAVAVYFVRTTQLPMLDVRMLFNAGSAQDEKLYGLANLTGMMLNEGTKKLNNNQIAEKFDDLGTQFGVHVNRDASIAGLRCLTKKAILLPSIELLHDIISQPVFLNKELKRIKRQILIEIAAQQQLPSVVATKTFYAALYKDFPYAHAVIGNKKTIASIDRSDVIKFYQQHYTAKNAILVLVGNISQVTAKALANKITADLPSGKTIKKLSPPSPVTEDLTKQIKFPGTQSYIRIGCLGLNYNDPHLFPILVGNYILGAGVLVSRLFTEIRQKYGLSYSVKSKFIALKNRGPFLMLLQTKNRSTQQALELTKSVLNKFIQNGPTKKELLDAKKFLLGNFALQLDSNAKIANTISIITFYNLPLNYLDTYKKNIRAVTMQGVKKAFQTIIGKQKLVTILVGQNMSS